MIITLKEFIVAAVITTVVTIGFTLQDMYFPMLDNLIQFGVLIALACDSTRSMAAGMEG